ncbi:MAG: GNAT family N-acetyltransferase [Pseudomonadota bacterium]|nr:GNAT family N-acetyltransferase [Pseudomonadota bacterium]HCW61868.1 N-acetyltransferase [Sphingobium sp.]
MAEFCLETDRLWLRAWRSGDAEPFRRSLDTDEVTRWLGGRQPAEYYDRLCAAMQQSQAEHGHCFWIMEDKAEGAIIGFCGPRRGRHVGTPIHGALELGWRLASSHWGKGYAKEAAAATVQWCRQHRPLDGRLIAYTVPGNSASRGLMTALGMQRQPNMDFDHPDLPPGHPLRRHITYTLEHPA